MDEHLAGQGDPAAEVERHPPAGMGADTERGASVGRVDEVEAEAPDRVRHDCPVRELVESGSEEVAHRARRVAREVGAGVGIGHRAAEAGLLREEVVVEFGADVEAGRDAALEGERRAAAEAEGGLPLLRDLGVRPRRGEGEQGESSSGGKEEDAAGEQGVVFHCGEFRGGGRRSSCIA